MREKGISNTVKGCMDMPKSTQNRIKNKNYCSAKYSSIPLVTAETASSSDFSPLE